MSKKTFLQSWPLMAVIVIIFALIALFFIVGSIVLEPRSKSANTSDGSTAVPSPFSHDQSGRISRNLTETSLVYTINPTYEKKFNIVVTNEGGGSSRVITITGKGCNDMQAVAGLEVSPSAPALSRHEIEGKLYTLSEPTMTAMMCDGEAANYDQQLINEMRLIFESLK